MQYVLCFMILMTGAVITIRSGFVQRYLGRSFFAAFQKEKGKEGISGWGALCTTLAATIGTGNIVGVATAVALGGPGALVWMLLSAFLGMAVKFAECALAVHQHGGPYIYIERKWGKTLAYLFALCGAATGSISMGTTLQMDSMLGVLDPSRQYGAFSFRSLMICAVVAVLAGLVLRGGHKGISHFCEAIIPVMGIGYIVCCGIILFKFRVDLPEALSLIWRSAFSPRAALGGAAGSIFQTVSIGVSRGILSNEAGLGSAPIAAAAAKDDNAMRQGQIAMLGVFVDTVIICSLTGLCVTVTGAWQASTGAAVPATSFYRGLGQTGVILLAVFLCTFAFTTVVGWYFFASSCFGYLSPHGEGYFRLFYIAMLLLTPWINSDRLWALGDILSAGMALPNLAVLLVSGKEIYKTVIVKE
ncbi:MAG: sodium:alanine symporter family protein [Clostridia bacterium]|nr:sodium:alanine symporter family protein [Clostridia bacterium]